MKNYIFLLAIFITAFGCDTASTIDPPDDSFFLKFYGYEGNQEGVDAVLNSDGTITLFGNTDSQNDGKQLYLVNIEPNGRIVWEQTLGGPLNEEAKDIELTNDGRLVIVANVENSPNEHDILIMTLTLDGNPIASSSPPTGFSNTAGPTDETAISVTQTNDGFIVVGSTSNLDLKPIGSGSSNDTRDALHIRYFDDLTPYPNTWRQAHGPGDQDFGVKMFQVSPTQFYFFSYTNTQTSEFNFSVLGLGVDGETNSPDNFLPGNPQSDEKLSAVIASPPQSGEGFVMIGTSTSSISTNADIFIVKLRKALSFGATDFQFQKSLGLPLGAITDLKASAFALSNSGYLILANEKSTPVQKWFLHKIGIDGSLAWSNAIIFGGEKDSSIGAVLEMPDGTIGIIGTFAIGEDGETKMTFIRVNKEGKFLK